MVGRRHSKSSDYQNLGEGERVQVAMANDHGEHAEQHNTQNEAHERIKKHHHTVMAQLAMLTTAIESAM